MGGLLLMVAAVLLFLGLLTWSTGDQGMVGVAGGVLAQLFGVVAWLVPVALLITSIVLLAGARTEVRWLSPLVPFGLAVLLLGVMGFMHLFTDGQRAADAGQGGGYLGLAISTLLSD
jgi:hypothetical protein